MLLFTAAEVSHVAVNQGFSPATAGLLGGMAGGVTQAYATMGLLDSLRLALIMSEYASLQQVSAHV